MGFDAKGMQFLLAAKQSGVSFAQSVTIGRQDLNLNFLSLKRNLRCFGINKSSSEIQLLLSERGGYAEPLLRMLGAEEVSSIDKSAYEDASIIHDMNQPIPNSLRGTFSVVIDGGSLEHVFDFPTAVRNCMSMIQPGGHFLGMTPANNRMGHGFYQFSPELLFRIFSKDNGFVVQHMLLTETSSKKWYEILDSEVIQQRVEIKNYRPTYIYIQAKKLETASIFSSLPQQSDYLRRWESSQTLSNEESSSQSLPQIIIKPIERWAPYGLMMTLKSIWHFMQATTPLGIDGKAFKRVDITKLTPQEA